MKNQRCRRRGHIGRAEEMLVHVEQRTDRQVSGAAQSFVLSGARTYPRTNPTLVMTKPMNSAELTIRIAITFSVHLTNAKLYSPASVG